MSVKSQHKKKIMLVSYHYPPSTAIGGKRIYGFAKHLKKLGWNVYVLTLNEKYIKNAIYDEVRSDGKIIVYRTGCLPKLSTTVLDLLKKIKSGKNKEEEIIEKNVKSIKAYKKRCAKEKIKEFVNSFLLLPDENRNWIILTLFKGIVVSRKHKIDIIFTSCPPYSVHIIGLLLKIILKVKWIVDYRDPWIIPFNKYLYSNSKASKAIEQYIEKLVIRKADLVTCTTQNLCKKFIDIYSREKSEKFLHFSNGYDHEILKETLKHKKYSTFTISYAGTLYFGRSVEPIFIAISQLKKEGKINSEDLKIRLIGDCQYTNGLRTIDLAVKYNLKRETSIEKQVNYKEAVKITRKSHIGLVLAPKQEYQIPGKIYDIIGARTKILAIAGDGATKNLIEELEIGQCFHWTDIDGIKKYIYIEFSNKKKNSEFKFNSKRYEQKEITKKLSLAMEELI